MKNVRQSILAHDVQIKNKAIQATQQDSDLSLRFHPRPTLDRSRGQRLIQDLRSRSDTGSCQPMRRYHRVECSGLFPRSSGRRLHSGEGFEASTRDFIGDLHSRFCSFMSDGGGGRAGGTTWSHSDALGNDGAERKTGRDVRTGTDTYPLFMPT